MEEKGRHKGDTPTRMPEPLEGQAQANAERQADKSSTQVLEVLSIHLSVYRSHHICQCPLSKAGKCIVYTGLLQQKRISKNDAKG